MSGFFEEFSEVHASGCTLVVLDAGICPSCSWPTTDLVEEQAALVRHGGYGATRRITRAHCAHCGWTLTAAVEEVKP